MAKFCSNCGTSLTDTAKFCAGCGTKQDDAPPVQQQPQPVQQQPQPVVQQPPIIQQTAQLYQQPQPAAIAPAKKKKSKIPIIIAVFGVFLVAVIIGVVLLVNSLAGNLSETAKTDYYEMGVDRVPSVKYVIGEERKITGLNTSTSGKVTTKEIKYEVSGPERRDEIYNYYRYLVEKDGFYNLTQINFENERSGDVVIGRNSDNDGYEIQIQLKYDTGGYTVTLLKQPGGITPKEPDEPAEPEAPGGAADENQAPETVLENPTPAPAPAPAPIEPETAAPAPAPEPIEPETAAPAPDNEPAASGGAGLTKDIFDILYGDTLHVKMVMKPDGEDILDDVNIETYAKNGMSSASMDLIFDMQLIVKNGKKYTVMHDFQMVFVEDADADEDETDFGIAPENIEYIGESSGEFYGKTYKYDEYKDSYETRYFYYVDGGALKGIRIISNDAATDYEILALDRNVPDSVFEIPSDYELVESEE